MNMSPTLHVFVCLFTSQTGTVEESSENTQALLNLPTTPATTRQTSSAPGPSPLLPSAESWSLYLRSTFPLKMSVGTIWSCERAVSVAGTVIWWESVSSWMTSWVIMNTRVRKWGRSHMMGSLGLSFISCCLNKPLKEVSLLFPQLCPIQWRLMRHARHMSGPSPSPPVPRSSGFSFAPMKETVGKAFKCLMLPMMVRAELLMLHHGCLYCMMASIC